MSDSQCIVRCRKKRLTWTESQSEEEESVDSGDDEDEDDADEEDEDHESEEVEDVGPRAAGAGSRAHTRSSSRRGLRSSVNETEKVSETLWI